MGSKLKFEQNGVELRADSGTVYQALLDYFQKKPPVIEQYLGERSALTPPALGEVWQGMGGVYVGIIRGDDGKSYYLIASKTKFKEKWGLYGNEIEGARSRNDGLSNTKAMAKEGSPVAKMALMISDDGHEDFYLPSQCELAMCFANAREHFDKEWHWSSTQYSAHGSWLQGFGNGTVGINFKSEALCAFAVRRFPQ